MIEHDDAVINPFDFLEKAMEYLNSEMIAEMLEWPEDVFLPTYAMLLEEYCKKHELSVIEKFEQLTECAKGVNAELGKY